MKLSVNEDEFTGLCTRNFATKQQVLILEFAFGPEELPGACFSKVPIINGPGKLSPFSLKIEVSIVLHVT